MDPVNVPRPNLKFVVPFWDKLGVPKKIWAPPARSRPTSCQQLQSQVSVIF